MVPLGQDSAAFAKRFPSAAAIDIIGGGSPQAGRRSPRLAQDARPMTAAQSRSFDQRFPSAGRIGTHGMPGPR